MVNRVFSDIVFGDILRSPSTVPSRHSTSAILLLLVAVTSWSSLWHPLEAADLARGRELANTGQYEECIAMAEEAIDEGERDESWWLLKGEMLLKLGRYAEAESFIEQALSGDDYFALRFSIRLRLLAREIQRRNAHPELAKRRINEITTLAQQSPWRYTQGPNLIALGRWALRAGEDPRQILEVFYDRAKNQREEMREAYLATGELALSKHDFAEAAKAYREGLEKFPRDSEMKFGLALSLAPSDWTLAAQSLQETLDINPRHTGALLHLVDRHIDAERYDEANELLDRIVEEINPGEPMVWAYRAVMAHLAGDWLAEEEYYSLAHCHWQADPDVDHLIGKKLSQHYRFREGADYQRTALQFDPSHLPAKIQLSQDLLRLGNESEGWRLANAVQTADEYDVVAYNLVTLKDTLDQFVALEDDDFLLRMSPDEAEIYGHRAMNLLHRAKEHLSAKYGLDELDQVTVEIFPHQKDFAVRTFGMPGGAGFLGVCFGRVITANSPASQGGNASNWESVLWHEFCHVITLELTRNRMPRWLSEGISVYEEKLENSTWGQSMNPRYREFVLGGELKPVSRLSEAFLSPPSNVHLQFAYYQSALVVEFIVDRFGLESLKRVLLALGAGVSINEALQRHVAPLELLDREFEEFAEKRANELAPEIDWEKPLLAEDEEPGAAPSAEAWLNDHSRSHWALLARSRELIEAEAWEDAVSLLTRFISLYPDYVEEGNAYQLLAFVHRKRNDLDEEQKVLSEWAARDADSLEAYARLMELGELNEQWSQVEENAQRYLAVNPLVEMPHRKLATAAEMLGKIPAAIEAYRAALHFKPVDPAETHFRLASLIFAETKSAQGTEIDSAKRHVLKSLEEAPRYRKAQRLLLAIRSAEEKNETEEKVQSSDAENSTSPGETLPK